MKKVGIVVNSEQVGKSSLVMGSLGNKTFLEHFLGGFKGSCDSYEKVYSMRLDNLQAVSVAINSMIESYGFEVFIGDRNDEYRMLQVAKANGFDIIVNIMSYNVLTVAALIDDLVKSHIASGADITVPHNVPTQLCPVVVNVDALQLAFSASDSGFLKYYNLSDGYKTGNNFVHRMLFNPQMFKANYHTVPVKWEGSFDAFRKDFTNLRVDFQSNFEQIRTLVYKIDKEVLDVDDIISSVLIENMKTAWSQPNSFDTKFIVANQAGWEDPEVYLKDAINEITWFVLGDKQYLNNKKLDECSIIEVGCGHGRLIRPLANIFKEIHGTDATGERIMEARYRCKSYDNITVTQNDGHTLRQYADNSFDFAYCHGVLVHINSKKVINNYISEMARVIKKGGRMKFDCYYGKGMFGITVRDFGIGARYSTEELHQVMNDAGLKVVNIEHVQTRQFSDTDDNTYSMPIDQVLVIGEKI